jgi:hypothetical protein
MPAISEEEGYVKMVEQEPCIEVDEIMPTETDSTTASLITDSDYMNRVSHVFNFSQAELKDGYPESRESY